MSVIDEIRKLEDRRYKAQIDVDQKTLNELLADDLIYTHSTARQDTKQSYIESMVTGKVKYHKFDRSEEVIRVVGDAAIVNGKVAIDVFAGGQERHLVNRVTVVWLRRNGKWQFASWQSTPIQAPH